MTRHVIIGNGAAGVTAAEEIRERDPRGHVVVISGEPYPMYSRPGLAYVVIDEVSDQQVIARKPEWYSQERITLLFGKAASIDIAARYVHLEDGRAAHYDRLLIASGARAVPPPYPGADLDGVLYLDTLDSAKQMLAKAKTARRAVVIGGGITAMEMAEGLAHHGVDTHYFVRKNTLWSTVFNETESKLLEQRIVGRGVTIHYNTEITEILGDADGRVRGVRLNNGDDFRCDLVGAAIGVKPQIEFARGTPIQVDRGILVNDRLETTVPDVYAAGDCAQVWDRWSQKHMLDVLWPTAIAAGRVAGANMAGAHQTYMKGVPFNACLLFGLHVTAIGQLGGGRGDDGEVLQHIDRGSSEVWATRPQSYASAWSQDGANTVRLVLDGDRLAGALIVGRQTLADPLRDLIEHQTDIRPLLPHLRAGGAAMAEHIQQFWRNTIHS
ncbi:MAG: NAD(P)/FAD-dependent oxidoreductase [Chloroflexi bacterium]|nr:NAD(P)/FAD-dependent oxidoreductase [Chloroflexota bacterium]